MKKLLSLTLALLMLLTLLASCKKEEQNEESSSSDTDITTTVSTDIVICKASEKTEYKIIYAEKTDKETLATIDLLTRKINNTYVGADIKSSMDAIEWQGVADGSPQILIGNTDRQESAEAAALLTKTYEYVIKVFENGRVAICATNERMLRSGLSYFMSQYIDKDEDGVLSIPKTLEYLYAEESRTTWSLGVPAYEGGIVSSKTYNIGPGVNISSNTARSQMQAVSNTNRSEFDAYIAKLEDNGYTKISKNTVENNVYVQYKNTEKSKLVYAYYIDKFKEARIIDDMTSIAETDFEYSYTPKLGETAAIYQWGMMYDANANGNNLVDPYPNNGMFYIIRLSDNSLVLIDGGGPEQATGKATEALVDFMYEITGTQDGEKIRISCIMITHPHGDHKQFVENLIKDHSDKINIERAMFNIPTFANEYIYFTPLGESLVQNFPNVKFIKPHTGQRIQLGDMKIDIIMTHEDLIDPDDCSSILTTSNNASTIMKLTLNGKSMMVLGDFGGDNSATVENSEVIARLLGMYENAEGEYSNLKCDIVQVAHHGINDGLGDVYNAIGAKYALFSQQDVAVWQMAHQCFKTVVSQLSTAGATHILFEGRYTHCLTIAQDGTITHTKETLRGANDDYADRISAYLPYGS